MSLRPLLAVAALGLLGGLAAGCGGSSTANPTNPAKPTAPRRAYGEDFAKSIVDAAAAAALKEAMTQLGLQKPETTLNQIQDQLRAIDSRLAALQSSINDARLEGRCEQARTSASPILSRIKAAQKRLKEASLSTNQATRVADLRAIETDYRSKFDDDQQALADILAGSQTRSLITDCGRYLGSSKPVFFTRQDSQSIKDFMDRYGYFESVLFGFRKGWRTDPAKAAELQRDFDAQVKEQDALVKPVLPENTFLDRAFSYRARLWRMTPSQSVDVKDLRAGRRPAWAVADRAAGWDISGFKNSDPDCDAILDVARRAPGGKLGDWMTQQGMLSIAGYLPHRIACWVFVTSDDPSITGYLKMADTNSRTEAGVPGDNVGVNVIEVRQVKHDEYAYIAPGEAP